MKFKKILILLIVVLIASCTQNETSNLESNNEISSQSLILEQKDCEGCNNQQFCYESICYEKKEELIVIFIDSETYKNLENEINRYKEDIIKDLSSDYNSVNVKIISEDFKDANLLKSRIKSLYEEEKLIGAVLIGDMPLAILEYESCEMEPCHHPVDYYYMDLGSNFIDTDNNNRLNVDRYEFNSDSLAEIWVGRIRPPVDNKGESIYLLKDYFNRNHNFRIGNIKSNGKLLSANFIEGKETARRFVEQTGIWEVTNSNTYTLIDSSISKQDYLSELKNNYLLVYGFMHGNVLGQEIKDNIGIYSSDIKEAKPNAFFYIFDSCEIGNIEDENNIASWYIFSGNGLVIRAFNLPVLSGGDRFPIILPLSQGITFGDSFRISSWTTDLLLGDPTLRLIQPPEFEVFNLDGFDDFLNINIGDVPLSDRQYPVVLEGLQINNYNKEEFKFINIWGASSRNLINHGLSTGGSFNGWNNKEVVLPVFGIKGLSTKDFQISLPTKDVGPFESTKFILTKDSLNPIVKQTIKGEIVEYFDIIQCGNFKLNTFKDACIFSIAKNKKDISLCNNINDNGRKDICKLNLALDSNNENQCNDISENQIRDECYLKTAISNKDSSICINILTEIKKTDCFKETGGNEKFNRDELINCLKDFNIDSNKVILYKGEDFYSKLMINSVDEIGSNQFVTLDSIKSSEVVDTCLKDLIKIGSTPQILCHHNGFLHVGTFSFDSEENVEKLREFISDCG